MTVDKKTEGSGAEAPPRSGLIRDFLPTRYEVGPIFAVDNTGAISHQIDVAVYDKHYSPQWFGGASGVRFVPVESVYAVFEVKPELKKKYLLYAVDKVMSVRSLDRTSAPIVHKGGKYETAEIDLRPIIGGILTVKNKWPNDTVKYLDKYLTSDPDNPGFLNIGIALDSMCFDYTPILAGETVTTPRTLSADQRQLIHFASRLFRQLQAIGTVPAVDMEKYEQAIHKTSPASAPAT